MSIVVLLFFFGLLAYMFLTDTQGRFVTLTYGQTELLLFFGKVEGIAKVRDCEEMKASEVCLKITSEKSQDTLSPLTQNFIRQLHRTLIREDYQVHYTLPDGNHSAYTIHAGQYKTRPNSVITRYGDIFTYASPEETPALMADLVDWYNETESSKSMNPVDLAALFHYRYIRIHPFEDHLVFLRTSIKNANSAQICIAKPPA